MMNLKEFKEALIELVKEVNATPTEIDWELEVIQLSLMREHLDKVVE